MEPVATSILKHLTNFLAGKRCGCQRANIARTRGSIMNSETSKQKKTNGKHEATELQNWLYSTGNFANNIIFLMVGTYVTYFYTNLLGISPFMAGLVFMVARLVDAITDPLMGMIVDHTNTKFGRYRPYIIAGAPFLGIMFVLLFTAPDLSPNGKVVYAFVTYIIYSLAWTVVQIPQLALPALLSNDIAKRTRIQAIFQAFGSIASLIISAWALPILDALGGQDNAAAWFKFTVIFGAIAVVIFILSAMSVKDLDVYDPNFEAKKKEKVPLSKQFQVITKNRALAMTLIAYGTDMFAYTISNSLRIYFFKYNMNGRTDLITYIGYASTIFGFALVVFIQPMVRKLGKRTSIILIEVMAIVCTLPMLFTGLSGAYSVAAVMFTYIAIAFTWTTNNMLSRSAVLDSANYAQIKTGINGTALVNSTFTFINKCCQAFSMFFSGTILSATGYNADLTQQTPECLRAILLLCTVVPIIGYACSVIAMKFYPISRQGEIKMQQEMDAIRDGSQDMAIDADLNI